LYRIQFRNGDRKRKSIRLSGVTKKAADGIRAKIEALNACRIAGQPMSADLANWVASRGDDLYDKLVDAGLLEPRQKIQQWTLGAFIDDYIASRNDVEDRTHINWKSTRHKLTDYFGEDRDLTTITEGDAFEWRQHIAKENAPATLADHVKFAKAFFRHAVRKRILPSNPFADLRGAATHNSDRQHFVSKETIKKAIDSCPDAQWRLILALCRFGGLRCPSEVLTLTWDDIDWDGERFTVTAPKTKKQGKPFRVVPLFPELRPYLDDAYDLAAEGDVFCITKYRSQDTNLRTQFQKILRRAEVEAWPRLFQNLRSSRETELAEEFPLHVVTAWLGHTPKIATTHYLQTTEKHYAKAVAEGGAGGGAVSGRKRQQTPADADAKTQKTLGNGVSLEIPGVDQYTPLDSNQ
jgi:integrase